MAEGWVRHLKRGIIEPYSAGVEKRKLDSRAVQVMAEAGVDISAQRSKLIEELDDLVFDLVITVCDHAREACPLFPGNTEILHQSFDDPPALAEKETEEPSKLAHYRRVRDQIRAFVETLPEALTDHKPS
jgi:arsenate reductase